MNATSKHTSSVQSGEAIDSSSVMRVAVRVAGRVPTRVDLRFGGSEEKHLGLSLGTVLVYVRTLSVTESSRTHMYVADLRCGTGWAG